MERAFARCTRRSQVQGAHAPPIPLDSPPPVGAEPLASVFGGILLLVVSAVLLVLRRDRLRDGLRLRPAPAAVAGALVGGLAYVAGALAVVASRRR